jgi:hypothetical protein
MIPLTRWPTISITIGVLVVVTVAAFAFCRPRPTPIPEKEQRSIDSLIVTSPFYRAQRETLTVHETTFVAQSAQHRAQSTQSTHAADSLRTLANAAQRTAEQARDTSSHWHDVAILRGLESDSLRSALGGAMTALEEQTRARTAADARSVLDSARLAATESLNRRLAADLARADPPCRVAFAFRCPSRRVVALVSIPLGVLATIEYQHRKP